eukprot:TRINITY_DN12931_c0_g1_i6.p1 TRINITY_DN12931_c0_g1~~TRINITY_DN12931_c0_g1_i6.p1  ORF type:complete len:382 (-),score=103.15 TRINITY_DN12931_c0_g1_i6:19-1038(-)
MKQNAQLRKQVELLTSQVQYLQAQLQKRTDEFRNLVKTFETFLQGKEKRFSSDDSPAATNTTNTDTNAASGDPPSGLRISSPSASPRRSLDADLTTEAGQGVVPPTPNSAAKVRLKMPKKFAQLQTALESEKDVLRQLEKGFAYVDKFRKISQQYQREDTLLGVGKNRPPFSASLTLTLTSPLPPAPNTPEPESKYAESDSAGVEPSRAAPASSPSASHPSRPLPDAANQAGQPPDPNQNDNDQAPADLQQEFDESSINSASESLPSTSNTNSMSSSAVPPNPSEVDGLVAKRYMPKPPTLAGQAKQRTGLRKGPTVSGSSAKPPPTKFRAAILPSAPP